jgi:hypothetical protein
MFWLGRAKVELGVLMIMRLTVLTGEEVRDVGM